MIVFLCICLDHAKSTEDLCPNDRDPKAETRSETESENDAYSSLENDSQRETESDTETASKPKGILKSSETVTELSYGFKERLNLEEEHVLYGSLLRRVKVKIFQDNRLCLKFGLHPNIGCIYDAGIQASSKVRTEQCNRPENIRIQETDIKDVDNVTGSGNPLRHTSQRHAGSRKPVVVSKGHYGTRHKKYITTKSTAGRKIKVTKSTLEGEQTEQCREKQRIKWEYTSATGGKC